MDLWKGKVAVVTGASEGIGEAILRKLAGHGMRVVGLARRLQLLQAIEKDVNSKGVGRVYSHVCDVSDLEQVKRAFAWIEENVGPVNVLVNNAALFKIIPLSEIDNAVVKSLIDINILGVMYCTQQAVESMKKSGINDGHIVNINSDLGHKDVMMFGGTVYGGTKHALTTITAGLKRELAVAKMKTRVTSVSPGLTNTTMSEWYLKDNPETTSLHPDDVADGVVYALSAPKHVNALEKDVNSKGKGKILGIVCDVSNEDQVKNAFQKVETEMGPVSVLVNNAGVFLYGPLEDIDMAVVKSTIDINVMGVMHCTQQALKSMKEHKINDGHIVNINSVAGQREMFEWKGINVYCASKHALRVLTRGLKKELAGEKMSTRVTSISPGLVETGMIDWFNKKYPGMPAIKPDDVTNAVIYALSAPSYLNISEVILESV